NEVVGRTILPSSNEVIGRTILPSSNKVIGRIMLDEIVLPAKQLPKNFVMSDWVQAMMDLANLICRVESPACDNCPLQAECLGKKKWRDYPQPKIKKAKPIFYGAVLICKNSNGEYLLERRPVNKKNTKPKTAKAIKPVTDISAGLYQGLLVFPMTPLVRDLKMLDQQVAKMKQQNIIKQLKNNCVVHDLTHRRLVLSLVFSEKTPADGKAKQGKAADNMIWVADDKLASLPLPSVMKKVIKQMAD
ncbi:MAG: NUDIX domain-containing protein, partial [Hydrotalea sp.]|nr:NUDIX domain-containing protein [Hydrotalea sp.]